MKLLSLFKRENPADLAERYSWELAQMNHTPFASINDKVGKKLEMAGLCRREWFEGMGAGFYLYYPAARASLRSPGQGGE